jgi:hypothetical protein
MSFRRISLVALILTIVSAAVAGPSEQWMGVDYLNGRAIVVMGESADGISPSINSAGIVEVGIPSVDAVFSEFECTVMKRLIPDAILDKVPTASADAYRTYLLEFRTEYPVVSFLEAMLATPYVSVAEPDLLMRLSRTPNDTQFNTQYDKTIMGAPAVWDLSTGDPDIICAGLDTGVDWRHPDLKDILWVNPGEDNDHDQEPWSFDDYPGDIDDLDGADNDGNGFADDFLGWDFIQSIGGCAANEDCDSQQDNDMFGRESHGTHVGGIMAAQGNNGLGVAGFTWVGKLMALRCGYLSNTNQGFMPQSATIPGTYYAVANGADIINMSYGGPGFSSPAQAAATAAWQAGLLLFGASGNDNTSAIQYPAGYDNVIAVNATNSTDRRASFSNYGTWTDLCAPGVSIPSTVINGRYESWDGTSMASPNAAGAAALLWALLPDFDNLSIRDLMYLTAENIDALNPGFAGQLGHGRVSIDAAAQMLLPNLTVTSGILNDSNGDSDGRLESGESGAMVLAISADANWANATNVHITASSTDPAITVSNGTHTLPTLAAGSSAPIEITLTAGSIPDAFWFTLDFAVTTNEGFDRTISHTMRVGRGRVVVIDDDGGDNFQTHFFNALEEAGAIPDLWTNSLDGTISEHDISEYQGVVWMCGNQTANSLTIAEQEVLSAYLNGGGNLLLSGQGVRNSISEDAFFGDYLHAASDADLAGDRQVRGSDGNVLFGDMNLLLQGGSCGGNGTVGPDRINAVNGGVAAFDYTTVGGTGAVMYEGTYKTLFCAFALEAACGLAGTAHFSVVLDRVLTWWGISTVDVDDHNVLEVPSTIRLLGNYPNPFNPSSEIRYEINTLAKVQLNVYDVQGRLVEQLVDEVVQPGVHAVRFDGSALASGVYFARLSSANFVQTTKMVLLK